MLFFSSCSTQTENNPLRLQRILFLRESSFLGAAVAQEEEQSSTNQKVSGLTPAYVYANADALVQFKRKEVE